MNEKMRVFKQVPRILFGKGSVVRLPEILPGKETGEHYAYVVDEVHQKTGILNQFPIESNDLIFWCNTSHEPTVKQADEMTAHVRQSRERLPKAIIGVGGGCTMDLAKAISVLLTNEGSAALYQGWDLIKNPGVYKVAVPTLSGTGAEASRTTVLTREDRKFGINSDASMYNAILCDALLTQTVPTDQKFYTAMDCYIHSVESIEGYRVNELSKAYATKGLELCQDVFLRDGDDDKLMVASFMGGASIVNSEVGICHALSYGLSLVLGYHHGIANCIAFNVLEDYYNPFVDEMRTLMQRWNIRLPEKVTAKLDSKGLQKMIDMALMMERPLYNALGDNWREKFTPDVIAALYARM